MGPIRIAYYIEGCGKNWTATCLNFNITVYDSTYELVQARLVDAVNTHVKNHKVENRYIPLKRIISLCWDIFLNKPDRYKEKYYCSLCYQVKEDHIETLDTNIRAV